MAGQGPSRRQLLQAIACASVASTAPGFCRWAYAFSSDDPQHMHRMTTSDPNKPDYKPLFFSNSEYLTIGVLAELILPGTALKETAESSHLSAAEHGTLRRAEDAGATDAGVAEFIDFMVHEDKTLQPLFRQGLAWLEHANASKQPFAALTSAEQVSMLERVAYRSKFRAEDKIGQDFFALMRRYTVIGFYTSRIGLESLDYPGLRFYATSPSVPQDSTLQLVGTNL